MHKAVFSGVLAAFVIFSFFVYRTFIFNPDGSILWPDPKGFTVRLGQDFPFFKSVDLKSIIKENEDSFAIYVKDLNSGEVDTVNEERGFYAASLFKVPLAISVLSQVEDGRLKLEDVDEMLGLLLGESDNDVQETLLDLADTNLVYSLMPDSDNLKITEIARIFEGIYRNEYLTEANTTLLLDYMTRTAFDDRIHAGLDVGAVFSHKIGNWPDTSTWHDCGILLDKTNPKILCLMSEGVSFEEFRGVAKEFGRVSR